tara:strand:+ start:812 stop:1291 length:480 start_codon:yes stop_codon:yes gene_type:complete
MSESDLHFTQLESKIDPTGFTSDTHLVVTRVIVVGKDVPTANGPLGDNPMHVDGETWCHNLFKGGTWKQTSRNNAFRKQFAGKTFIYDSAKDIFIGPQPYASWTLDVNDDWQSPVTFPTDTTDKTIGWDEGGQKWTAKDHEDPRNDFDWDPSGLTWVSA